MSAALTLSALSLPAMLLAGLASSAHCALMCGLLQGQGDARQTMWRHAGRLCAYAILGAVAGGAGAWLLRSAAWIPASEGLRVAALPVLLWLLLRRSQKPKACCAPRLRHSQSPPAAFAAGLATGLVPCVLLYAAAAHAMLSASAVQGALLMAAFGLGTVPAVQAGAWGWRRLVLARGAVAAPTAGLLGALALLLTVAGLSLGTWCLN